MDLERLAILALLVIQEHREIVVQPKVPVLVAIKVSAEIKVWDEPATAARFTKVEPMINLPEADQLPIAVPITWRFDKMPGQPL